MKILIIGAAGTNLFLFPARTLGSQRKTDKAFFQAESALPPSQHVSASNTTSQPSCATLPNCLRSCAIIPACASPRATPRRTPPSSKRSKIPMRSSKPPSTAPTRPLAPRTLKRWSAASSTPSKKCKLRARCGRGPSGCGSCPARC